jgi:hypothetical protein
VAIVQTRRLPPAGTSDNRFISEAINGAMSNVELLDAHMVVPAGSDWSEMNGIEIDYIQDGLV